MKVRAYNIEWETNGQDVKLPEALTFNWSITQEELDDLAKVLSNTVGFIVNAFEYEILEDDRPYSLSLRDREGKEVSTYDIGKNEGQWNPDSPDEMDMLINTIQKDIIDHSSTE